MHDGTLDLVTGAFSYTGWHIARRLLDDGRRVRTLTGHPDRHDPFGGAVEVQSYHFDDPVALTRSLDGVDTLYNTYWVRFTHGRVRFDDAVENSRALFHAAARAGVRRVVHVSITNPAIDSALPYFRGKALVERALAETNLPFTIVRPTVLFGGNDVLINNIAWLLRHVPVFGVAGDGEYRLRPVHVDDVARICVEGGAAERDLVVDAMGPETFGFEELVRLVGDAIGRPAHVVHLPPGALALCSRVIGAAVRDVLLTREEIDGLMAGLITTEGPATGRITFTEWLAAHADELGRRYASELGRHYEQSVTSETQRADVIR